MKTLLIGVLMMSGAAAEQLRITAYDEVNLPREVSGEMVHELRCIFRQARIEIVWVSGDPSADEASQILYSEPPRKGHERDAACRARQDIALKIVAKTPPGLDRAVLGMALPRASAGLNVKVFDDRIRNAAQNRNRSHAVVLAHAIAHEVGHVLLRSDAHTSHGLMGGMWTEREYGWMAKDGMLFTDTESTTMRMTLAGTGCRASGLALGASAVQSRTRGR